MLNASYNTIQNKTSATFLGHTEYLLKYAKKCTSEMHLNFFENLEKAPN